MTLSTRQQLDSEFLTEPELEYSVLTYLSLRDLLVSKFVSHSWHTMINQLPWEEIFRRDPNKQSYFIKALVRSIRQKEYEQIHYWINLGAELKLNFDERYTGKEHVSVQFSFRAASAHFVDPTVLSVAANLLSGEPGAQVVCSLVYNGANFLISSKWIGAESVGYGEFPAIVDIEDNECPLMLSRDDNIRFILYLAEFERELKDPMTMRLDFLEDRLIKANDSRHPLTIEYLDTLQKQRGNDFKIRGISRDLTNQDKSTLINIDGYHEFYQYITHPSVFRKHWQSFIAGGLGSYLSACLFSHSSILLGKCIIGLFTTAITGSAVPLILGTIMIGSAVGMLYTLLKMGCKNYSHRTTLADLRKENVPKIKKAFGDLPRHGLFFKSSEINHKPSYREITLFSEFDTLTKTAPANDLETKSNEKAPSFSDFVEINEVNDLTEGNLLKCTSPNLQDRALEKLDIPATKEKKRSDMLAAREAWLCKVPKGHSSITIAVVQDGEESRTILPTRRIGSSELLNQR